MSMLLNELMGCGKTVRQRAVAWGVLNFSQINSPLTLGKSFNFFET